MEINFKRIKSNPRIEVLTATELVSWTGTEGNFKVELETKARRVNSNCTLCADCVEVCPRERLDAFNEGMCKTKAVYLPHDLAYPAIYSIDEDACAYPECNKCESVCTYGAIDLKAQTSKINIVVGSIVLATGWEPYEAGKIENLKFGTHPDIITSLMMERMAAANGPNKGEILCPSDGRVPQKIAFIQCAGSRDHNHLPYCSGVCCSASMKQALNLADALPDSKISIHYIDLRVSGRNEDFLRKVEDKKSISLVKGKVGSVEIEDGKLNLIAEDIVSGRKVSQSADLVVLATGLVPGTLPGSVGGKTMDYQKVTELPKGMYLAGCSFKPMDISSSLKNSTGIALKAIGSLISSET